MQIPVEYQILIVGSASVNLVNVPKSLAIIVFQNIIQSGNLSHESSTGLITCSSTGLYKINATLQLATLTNDERKINFILFQENNTIILSAQNHLAFVEYNTSFSAIDLNGIVRLVSGTKYRLK